MPKFESYDYSELKQYLEYILSDSNIDSILNSIVDNENEKLWNFVVGYKLIAHQLEKLTIRDAELAYLCGKFLGYYHAVELLHKKCEEKKMINSNLDFIISNSEYAIDILSDLYMVPSISSSSLSSKYKKNINQELRVMTKEEVIEMVEKEKECYYMLTDSSRKYMKKNYFFNYDDLDNKSDDQIDKLRSRTLFLLRRENKKEK